MKPETLTRPDPDMLKAALKDADLRVLLMCLVHLTGDRRWMEDPFLPIRDIRLIADQSAGFSENIQDRIRAAAFEILSETSSDVRLARPDDDMLLDMMRVCLGEQIGREYLRMMLEDMGFVDTEPNWKTDAGRRDASDFHVVIVGAGVSGLCAAAKLQQLGVSYTVIEKNREVGGTWFENRYPSCGVDTPNHFYSYSFEPNHDWRHYFAPREEIQAYLEGCAQTFEVRDRIRFETTMTGATWDESAARWTVSVEGSDGAPEQINANAVIGAVGQLNRPTTPEIPGADSLKGVTCHSARWPDDLDLRDRKVVVIGTGASAMQLVPAIAPEVASLTIVQRSPQWVRPVDQYDGTCSDGAIWLLKNVPFYATWYRFTLFWRYGDGLHASLIKDPDWQHKDRSVNARNDRHRSEMTDYLRSALEGDDELIAKALPDYPPFGKRILIDNGWFATLLRPNVNLVQGTVDRIVEDGVVTADGRHCEADVVIFATGFQITDMFAHTDVRGRDGVTLADRWNGEPHAYKGIVVPDFPNLFLLYGPNTNLGHGGSIIFHVECQVRYVMGCLIDMIEKRLSAIDCRPDLCDQYNRDVIEAHDNLIWTHKGMTNWYRTETGRIVSVSPWRLVDYWSMTHDPDLDDFVTTAKDGQHAA